MVDLARRASGIARRDLLKAAGFAALPLGPLAKHAIAAGPDTGQLWGVNLAGADFGNLLGTHGTEYLYPPPENIAYYARLGFSLVRIPFKWERLQPDLNVPFAQVELGLLVGVVGHASQLDLTVVLDPHNYAKRRLKGDGWKQEYAIGSSQVPLGAFLDFWARLSDRFKSNEKVVFGLMNEPVGLPAPKWLEIANAAIAAIRASGARNMIFVPGTEYSGAHSWFTAGNTVLERVKDPGDNFAIEAHQYFDSDSSGTKPSAVSSTIGSERIEAFQSWARKLGFRAFLGEYNGGRDAVSARALMDLCDEMAANSDVWLGSAAWAGGPRWPEDDMFNLEPYKDGRIREQTAIIQSRARLGAKKPFWSDAAPALYADFARKLAANNADPASFLRPGGAREANLDRPGGLAAPAFIKNKGLPIGATSIVADGDLAALLARPEFTILIETREIDPKAGEQRLLSSGAQRLLYCNAQGALASDLGGGLATVSRPPVEWKPKRRCALSIRRQTQEVMIRMTGAASVAGRGMEGFPDRSAQLQIGSSAAQPGSGYITRIVGFDTFLGADQLASNVA
jgi:endoglucanase